MRLRLAGAEGEKVITLHAEEEDGGVAIYAEGPNGEETDIGSFELNSKEEKVLFTRFSGIDNSFIAKNKRGRILVVGK